MFKGINVIDPYHLNVKGQSLVDYVEFIKKEFPSINSIRMTVDPAHGYKNESLKDNYRSKLRMYEKTINYLHDNNFVVVVSYHEISNPFSFFDGRCKRKLCKTFWRAFGTLKIDFNKCILDIWNESTHHSWNKLKKLHLDVLGTIRTYTTTQVLFSTPHWSSTVIMEDLPPNCFVSLHLYPTFFFTQNGTYKSHKKQLLVKALESKIFFVTEFGSEAFSEEDKIHQPFNYDLEYEEMIMQLLKNVNAFRWVCHDTYGPKICHRHKGKLELNVDGINYKRRLQAQSEGK